MGVVRKGKSCQKTRGCVDLTLSPAEGHTEVREGQPHQEHTEITAQVFFF